jgi:hypothetical protein
MSQVYHSSQNLVGSIANAMHSFTLASPTTVDVTISNPQNLPGQVQLLNSAGAVVIGNNAFTRTTLPAGTYRWNIVGGPANAVLGATGHVTVVQDGIN